MKLFSTPDALAINFRDNGTGLVRRHALLPAAHFEQGGVKSDVTDKDLKAMAALMTDGTLGEKRAVTLAHPHGEAMAAAPAVGWMLCQSAAVAPYKGTVALYVDVEWLEEMAADIDAKRYQYLSPVFTDSYVDAYGNERGWALLFAGVTNSPHWTDQPGLWTTFTALLTTDGESRKKKETEMAGMDPAAAAKLMEELQVKQAEYDALKAQYDASTKELDELKTKLAEATGQAQAAQAEAGEAKAVQAEMTARITALEGEQRKAKGDTLISQFVTAGVPRHKLLGADGKPTVIGEMAFTAPAQFVAAASLLDKRQHNTTPVGSSSDNEMDAKAREQAAFADAKKFCDANPKVDFVAKFHELKKEASNG